MTDVESKANEASPLIVDAEEQPSTSSLFSTPVKVAMALGASLALGAVAFLSYDKVGGMPVTTSMAHVERGIFDNVNFAMCPNYYVMGLTPRTAEDGCAIISQQDLFDPDADQLVAYTVTVCTNGPKHLDLNYDTLVAMGFTPNRKGSLGLSSMSLGNGVSATMWSGKEFSGLSKVVDSGPVRFPETKYIERDVDTNDDVSSIQIVSKTNGDVWAGRGCGIQFSVCPAVVASSVVRGPVEDGCVIVAGNDPTSPTYYDTEMKAVRFCAADAAGKTTVTKDNLQALELVQTWGDWDSTISYMNKGASLYTVFYEGSDANTRISGINTGSGSLVHMYYRNGHSCNDNVFSIDIDGGDPKIPVGCDFVKITDDDPAHDAA